MRNTYPPVAGQALEQLLEDVEGIGLFNEIKRWALDALQAVRSEYYQREWSIPLAASKVRPLNRRIIRLQQANNISQVIEIVEEQSDTMADRMLEAFGLKGA